MAVKCEMENDIHVIRGIHAGILQMRLTNAERVSRYAVGIFSLALCSLTLKFGQMLLDIGTPSESHGNTEN